ncbi:DUF4276 family protein [Flagellimonas oceanensis]|uniref:DUF4276 family protein n=1 Tax=Flagellimonas oceanensis TaxID=2499163 RepID=UPI000F8CF67B|nr:DUF4276 family protein [Allomuricauda oceanensis]
MKRLIIIVEGDTELAFVNTILAPYLYSKGILSVSCFKIKHSKGGLSKYEHLKKDILNVVYENGAVVTTLIDFYALPHDFPDFSDSLAIAQKSDRLDFLESAIQNEVELSQGRKFENLIPYIQLHEFEALVFSSMEGFESLFENSEADFDELNSIFEEYPNPEDINDDPNTAPSKRLIKNIRGYDKVLHGSLLLDEITIEVILQKCPRFSCWVNKLITILTSED